MKSLPSGWYDISPTTRLYLKGGLPNLVETSGFFGQALDEAETFCGLPLEQAAPWVTADGLPDPDGHATMTCAVVANTRDEPTAQQRRRL